MKENTRYFLKKKWTNRIYPGHIFKKEDGVYYYYDIYEKIWICWDTVINTKTEEECLMVNVTEVSEKDVGDLMLEML